MIIRGGKDSESILLLHAGSAVRAGQVSQGFVHVGFQK